MFTPKRPNPPNTAHSKKAPEGEPVQRIGFRATRTPDEPGTAQEPTPERRPASTARWYQPRQK